MTHTAQELVKEVTSLISLPSVGLRVGEMLEREDTSSDEVAAVIAGDPALTAAVLRVANSALMVRGKPVDSVSKAITRLGAAQVQELTLGISVASSFQGVPNELVSVNDFWMHSLYCAIASRVLAEKLKVPDREAAFTAGLLHDLGQLVIFSKLPEESHDFLTRSLDEYDGLLTHLAEREVLGFDHTDVGAALAQRWHFPEILCQCIEGHHEPSRIENCPPLVYVVHIANSLAVLAELHSHNIEDAPPIDPAAWQALGLAEDIIPEVITTCHNDIAELMKLFTPEAGKARARY